jgi:diguanylate cyclase (GGDEF)-like protein
MWYLAILILLLVFLYLQLKKIFAKIILAMQKKFQHLRQNYDNLFKENAKLKKRNSDLEKATSETVLLYDITKEICKFLDLDKIFASFKGQINKYVKVGDCKFLKNGADLSLYDQSAILPLKIDNEPIGYLVLNGTKDKDKDKCHILVQQFLLGLKRAYLYQKIQELAITDSLTGVFARRYSLERLNEELERSKKFKYNFSFLMIDIDHFKEFNDQYGHLVGDAILREVSKVIKDNVRQIDLVGRYGGEEFLAILPEADKEQAKFAAERIRQAVASQQIKVYDENLKVTISIGISTFPQDSQGALTLIEKADLALYDAKGSGRNKVCVYSPLK